MHRREIEVVCEHTLVEINMPGRAGSAARVGEQIALDVHVVGALDKPLHAGAPVDGACQVVAC